MASKQPELDDRCAFSFSEKYGKTHFDVTTIHYHPFKVWIPFCDFDGTFLESDPMQVRFSVESKNRDAAIAILISKGYKQFNPYERNCFSIRERNGRAHFFIETVRNDPYKEWIPFSDFDGRIRESYPAQANFSVELKNKDATTAILISRGYKHDD